MSKQVICKKCGYKFSLTEKQIKFYDEHKWATPNHCNHCRKEARQEKASRYYSLYEAIVNYTPCKKRRQRVHYKPHFVGGFK